MHKIMDNEKPFYKSKKVWIGAIAFAAFMGAVFYALGLPHVDKWVVIALIAAAAFVASTTSFGIAIVDALTRSAKALKDGSVI